MEQKTVPGFNQELDFPLLIYIIRKQLKWIFVILFLCAAVSFIYLRYTTPLYESSAVIQLTDENANMDLLDSREKFNENGLAQDIELLRSPVFLQRTLDSLPLQITYFNKGRIIDFDNYCNGPYQVKVTNMNAAAYGVPVSIDFKTLTDYTISYVIGKVRHEYNFNTNTIQSTDHFDIQTFIRDDAEVLKPTNFYYFKINDPAGYVHHYAKNLKITVLNDAARTIKITNSDVNYSRASDVVNGVANEFKYFNLEKKRQSVDLMIEYIDKTLGIVKYRLNEADSSLAAFKKENRINDDQVEIDPRENSNLELIKQYENRKFDYEIQLLILDDVIRNVNQPEINIYDILTQISQIKLDGYVSNIVSNLNALLVKRDALRQQVTESSREMKEVNAQIDNQKKLLIQSLNTIRENYQSRIKDLNVRIKATENLIYSEDNGGLTSEVELVQRKRMYEINQKYYDELISKKAEYTLAREGYTPGYRILKYAQPNPIPVSPRKLYVVGGAVLVWILLSLSIIVLRYVLHDKIVTINDITKYTNASILGIVVKYKEDIPVSQLIVNNKPKSIMAESFRSIRSNLDFISNEPGSKLISVTSTISGEGKTFVSINLAGILAFAGKKVIIIDADMRKPKIHVGFNTTNEKGLSTLLIGKDDLKDCIRESQQENLFYITAGPIPPNPSELLLGQRMNNLVDELLNKYDYVLIDNPPVGIVSDGLANLAKADFPIYVFRSDYSRRFFINNLERLIHENKINKLSVVLNGVDLKKSSRYGYTYGYGGRYGQRYGYGDSYGYIHQSDGYYDEDGIITKRKFSISRLFRIKKNDRS